MNFMRNLVDLGITRTSAMNIVFFKTASVGYQFDSFD